MYVLAFYIIPPLKSGTCSLNLSLGKTRTSLLYLVYYILLCKSFTCFIGRHLPEYFVGYKSSLVQVMAWCLMVPDHYLNQWWPRYVMPFDITRPQYHCYTLCTRKLLGRGLGGKLVLLRLSVLHAMSALWLLAYFICGTNTTNYYTIRGHNEVVGGILVSLRPSICLSVRPASRVRSVAPTVLVGSISYLYILSSNFRSCVAC